MVVEGTDLFAWRTSLEEPIPVDKGSKARIALPIKISYAEVYKTIPAAEGKTKLNGYATGLMIFTDAKKRQEKVPFAFSGEFPVFKDVEIKVQPIDVKVLTIGGTEFVFSFSLRNPNDFELVLGDTRTASTLTARPPPKERSTGENQLDAAGDKAFSLPVMLDFFEVGKEFYAIFDKPAAAGRLSLTATADSIWGPIKLSYTQAGQAQLKAAD